MTISLDIKSLEAYYLKQYKRHLADLEALVKGELHLLTFDSEPTCLSALQMATDNALIAGQRLTALQEVKKHE